MKENLKIKRSIRENNIEAMDLFNEIGLIIQSNCFAYLYADNNGFHGDRIDYEEITLPELRELARPKEYLNDLGELIESNQPQDGWTLVNGRDYIDTGRIVWNRENKVEATKGRFLHQEWYEAFGRGDDVQIAGEYVGQYSDITTSDHISVFNNTTLTFRLKPKTIQIGSRTINKPISVKPEIGTVVYMPHLTSAKKVVSMIWEDNHLDYGILSKNLCHITEQDAINHTDALLELVK